MSDSPQTEHVSQAQSAKPAKAALHAERPGEAPSDTAEKYTAATRIGSINELKLIAPDLYRGMLQGIAQNMTAEMQRQQRRLKKAMRDHK